jgi:hypothetical protein
MGRLRMAQARTTALQILGTPVTSGTQSSAYAGFAVTGVGGRPPYSFSIVSGALPAGMTLNPSSGVTAGTPTVAGSFASIIYRATDYYGHTADLAGFDLTVAAAGGATMPTTQSLTLGAKTRRRHRAYDCQSTGGTLTITSDPSGLFAIYSNKLAIAGIQDAAPPTLTGPYTVAVNNGTDSSTVTITIAANAYSVATKAELDYVRALQLALGDTVYLAAGTYNETHTDWRPGLGLAPTGTWTGSNWVTFEGEVKSGPVFGKCGPDGGTFTNHYLRFKKIKFARPNIGGTDPQATGQLQLQNGIKFICVEDCYFEGANSSVGTNNVSGIVNTVDGSDLRIVNNQFFGLNNCTNVYGPRHYVALNTAQSIWEDAFHSALQWDSDYLFNTCWDKKYYPIADNLGPHGDYLQIANTGLGSPSAGVYTGFRIIGNVFHRGNGQTAFIDGAGIFIEADTGVTYTGTKIQENLVVGNAAGINISGHTDAEISFNTLVHDTTTGITDPPPGSLPPTIVLRRCTGGNLRYNAIAATINRISEVTAPSIMTPLPVVNQAAQSSAYVAPFQGPVSSRAALIAAYAYKAGGPTDKANAGGSYHSGFNSNGFADFTAGTSSLPF